MCEIICIYGHIINISVDQMDENINITITALFQNIPHNRAAHLHITRKREREGSLNICLNTPRRFDQMLQLPVVGKGLLWIKATKCYSLSLYYLCHSIAQCSMSIYSVSQMWI